MITRARAQGKTAYDLAAQHGHAECASLLMKEGADALLHYQCPPVPTSSQRYENKGLAETTHDRFGWVVRETTRARARARAPTATASGSSSSSSCNPSASSSSNTVPTRASARPKARARVCAVVRVCACAVVRVCAVMC
jgi:ankyrin repeat protein